VATREEIQEWRALRGRFLNALWDLEKTGIRRAPVLDVLSVIGAEGITEQEAERLVRNLMDDGLITESDSLVFDLSNESVGLTGPGRYEVEQWLAEPDEPTEHLPVPASQVFSIGTMNVTGTVVQGSTATNINTNFGTSGAELVELVAQFRQLLAGADVSPDDRETIEVDLEVIEEEATAAKPRWARLRPFLRRLRGVLEKGALAGLELSTKQDVTHLIDKAEHAIAALQ
jgi:hypothetical protein